MFKRWAIAGLSCLIAVSALAQEQPARQSSDTLTDAAVVALIIAASVAAYKATGRPCACPDDPMRNGRRCGRNSAWSRDGGFKPLCVPSDVTPEMIRVYRATNGVPPLK